MPTLQQSVIAIPFAMADPAANAGGGGVPTPFGLPDTADVAAILMPFTGTIVGIAVTGSPAAGDSVTVIPQICITKAGGGAANCASLSVQITSAAPAASATVSKDQADCQFTAGQFIGVFYQTATGGAYTVHDVHVTLFISTGREDL
ncbi:MAG TPA: hypothetical protein VKV26_06610 [Dehalococcoidia bacterium]|nr:hypothetical protein [Dehalococcoidia bacterium]